MSMLHIAPAIANAAPKLGIITKETKSMAVRARKQLRINAGFNSMYCNYKKFPPVKLTFEISVVSINEQV